MNTSYINTSQNVTLDYPLADIGNRILAYLLDMLFLIIYSSIFVTIFIAIAANSRKNISDEFAGLLVLAGFLIYLPVFTYSLWAPYFMQGQTFGKKIMNIKIVRMDGHEAGFGTYLVRWLLNIVDFGIAGAWLGLLIMATSQKKQRVADMVAKTVVISTTQSFAINQNFVIPEEYQPTFSQVLQLSDKDVQIIRTSLMGAKARMDHNLVKKLREKVESVIHEYRPEMTDVVYLDTVLKDYNFYSQR